MKKYLRQHFLTIYDLINLEKCGYKMSLLVDPNQAKIKVWQDNVKSRIKYAIKLCKEYLQKHNDEVIEQTKNHLILTLSCYQNSKKKEDN